MKKFFSIILLAIVFVSCNTQKDDPANTDDIAIITTEFGEIHVVLYDETPQHKDNFLKLAREGFYDSTTFHRVMNEFMIQGGDPNSKDDNEFNDGQGGPGYTVEAEFRDHLIHKKGALAAARLSDQQNPEKRSSGSQFYIVHGRPTQGIELDQTQARRIEMTRQDIIRKYIQSPEQEELLNRLRNYLNNQQTDSANALIVEIEPLATAGLVPFRYTEEHRAIYADIGGAAFLDGNYTVFGEVIQGLDIVDQIAVQETNQADRPISDIPMSVRVETMNKKDIETKYGYTYN